MKTQPQPPHMRQEPDRPNIKALAWVGVGTLLVFGAFLVGVVFLLRGAQSIFAPVAKPPKEVGELQIGIVNQRLMGWQPEHQAIERRAAAQLGTYGWVDRDAGLVHLPIDRALELAAKGVRP